METSLYTFNDYKAYLTDRIQLMPRKGHGQYRRLAAFLNVNSTMVSQILSGDKHFTSEQAVLAAEYFGLSAEETDYLLTLIQMERAGSQKLKKFYQKKVEQLKSQSQKSKIRMGAKKNLELEQQSIFYSDYLYSAVRLLTSISGINADIEYLTERLKVPRKDILNSINFLQKNGLIVNKETHWEVGPAKTHIDADSPFVSRHHANWRMMALRHHPRLSVEELAFTSPLTISKKDFEIFRNKVLELIKDLGKIVDKTEPEELSQARGTVYCDSNASMAHSTHVPRSSASAWSDS